MRNDMSHGQKIADLYNLVRVMGERIDAVWAEGEALRERVTHLLIKPQVERDESPVQVDYIGESIQATLESRDYFGEHLALATEQYRKGWIDAINCMSAMEGPSPIPVQPTNVNQLLSLDERVEIVEGRLNGHDDRIRSAQFSADQAKTQIRELVGNTRASHVQSDPPYQGRSGDQGEPPAPTSDDDDRADVNPYSVAAARHFATVEAGGVYHCSCGETLSSASARRTHIDRENTSGSRF